MAAEQTENSAVKTEEKPAEAAPAPAQEEDDIEIRKRPWTKDRTAALVLQLFIVIMAVGAAIAYKWYKNRTEKYKTGIMESGELCIAYLCATNSEREEFVLKGGALAETTRFAFVLSGNVTRAGRIYTPVAEGEAELYTAHSEESIMGKRLYEHITVTVGADLNITFTQESISQEDYEAAVNGESHE